jgi:hypothetical protein
VIPRLSSSLSQNSIRQSSSFSSDAEGNDCDIEFGYSCSYLCTDPYKSRTTFRTDRAAIAFLFVNSMHRQSTTLFHLSCSRFSENERFASLPSSLGVLQRMVGFSPRYSLYSSCFLIKHLANLIRRGRLSKWR